MKKNIFVQIVLPTKLLKRVKEEVRKEDIVKPVDPGFLLIVGQGLMLLK